MIQQSLKVSFSIVQVRSRSCNDHTEHSEQHGQRKNMTNRNISLGCKMFIWTLIWLWSYFPEIIARYDTVVKLYKFSNK